MENFPVSPHLETACYSARSTSPARSRGHSTLLNVNSASNPHQHQVPPRPHANSGKKSEPLVSKVRHRSPIPGRKGPDAQLPQCARPSTAQEEVSSHASGAGEEMWTEFPSGDTGGNISNGSSVEYLSGQMGEDSIDAPGGTPDIQRTRAAIEQIRQKIQNTKDMITQEQKIRDENVDEYLRVASSAGQQQIQRIKNVFEKKNQKSAQVIAQLQKKLENYSKRIRELEMYGVSSSHYRQPKEVLKNLMDVGANIREGISGLSAWFVPESGEEALNSEEGGEKNHHHSATFTTSARYTSDDDCSSVTSGSGPTPGTGTMSSPRNQILLPPAGAQAVASSSSANNHTLAVSNTTGAQSGTLLTATSIQPSSSTSLLPPFPPHDVPPNLDSLFLEFQFKRDEWQRLQDEVDALKNQVAQDIAYFSNALLEEKYRYERLEEQMNDLIELHQNEIENLKQGIADMEEKLQYQSEERLRDIHEMMEGCQTRISRMEHQQHEQQQLVNFEGIENSNARAVVLKLINVLLTFLQVILLLVATASNILMPFIKTRFRILSTTIMVLAILLVARQWQPLTDYVRDFIHSRGFL